jgi:ribosomal silencing factor RsfS
MNNELREELSRKFLTAEKFAQEIESIVLKEKINYIDAIVLFCDNNNIEVESVSKLVTKPLKEKLKWDAIRLNYIKKTSKARLPI